MNRVFSILFLLFAFSELKGQWIDGIAFSGNLSKSIPQTNEINAVEGSYPHGFQIDLIKMKNTQEAMDICNCYPRSGVSLSYFNLDAPNLLGQSLMASLFIEPQFKISQKYFISIKAAAGLAFANKKYHPIDNPQNLTYSSLISNYLVLGFSNHYFFKPNLDLFLGLQVNHISNGGIHDPNNGLNFPGANLGLSYFFNQPEFNKSRIRKYGTADFPRRFSAAVFYTATTTLDTSNKKFPIYGLDFGTSKRLNGVLLWNANIEFYKDEAVKQKLIQDGESPNDQYRLGLSSGIGFQMDKFQFSSSLGVYLFDPINYYSKIFHRHEISYALSKHWSLGLNMKAHTYIANFVDARIKYIF